MRGQFYSIIAVLITIPIFIFTVNYLNYSERLSKTVADRIVSDQMSQLEQSIELDTIKAMQVSGRRALLAAANFVISSGEPISDAPANLTTLMLEGTINGTESFMLLNNTMPNWSQRITGNPVNFDVTLEYGNISIENHDGFSIRIGMDLNITVTDKLKESRIEKNNVRKYVTISIVGLEDPMFPLNTQGFIRRIIRRADPDYANVNLVSVPTYALGNCSGPVTFNKSEDDNTKILVAENISGVVYARHLGIILEDVDNLTGQIDCFLTGNTSAVENVMNVVEGAGYEVVYIDQESKSAWSMPVSEGISERYYYRDSGPDFLQRLEGNYTASGNGLSTFIYVPEFEEQAFPIEGYSRVAYRYFDKKGSCSQVRNMPAWFGMDASDAASFNMTGILTSKTCESASS